MLYKCTVFLWVLTVRVWWSSDFSCPMFSYLLPEHLGPCTLRITHSAHTDLSVKFQSHRSWYSLALSFWYLDSHRYSMCNVFLLWKSCLVGCSMLFVVLLVLQTKISSIYVVCSLNSLLSSCFPDFLYLNFCWFRDYTNPNLPVAQSAIDANGMVRCCKHTSHFKKWQFANSI